MRRLVAKSIADLSEEEYQNLLKNPPVTLDDIKSAVNDKFNAYLDDEKEFVRKQLTEVLNDIQIRMYSDYENFVDEIVMQLAKNADFDYNELVEVLKDGNEKGYNDIVDEDIFYSNDRGDKMQTYLKECFSGTVKDYFG